MDKSLLSSPSLNITSSGAGDPRRSTQSGRVHFPLYGTGTSSCLSAVRTPLFSLFPLTRLECKSRLVLSQPGTMGGCRCQLLLAQSCLIHVSKKKKKRKCTRSSRRSSSMFFQPAPAPSPCPPCLNAAPSRSMNKRRSSPRR